MGETVSNYIYSRLLDETCGDENCQGYQCLLHREAAEEINHLRHLLAEQIMATRTAIENGEQQVTELRLQLEGA